MKGLCTLAVAFAVGMVAAARADVTIVPLNDTNCSDNFLYNNGPGQNFAGSQLYYYDQRGTQLDQARPLIKFQLPTLPSGAVVQHADLGLWVVDYTFIDAANGNTLVPWPFSLHRMLVDWTEGGSNWSERSAGVPWGSPGMAPGTDYESSAAATTVIDSSSTTSGQYKTWDITALYQAWSNGTAPNFGVCVLGPIGNPALTGPSGDTTDGVFRAANSEWENDDVRPRLIITYTLPGNAACCFADGTCQDLSSADCTTAGGTAQLPGTVCSPNPCPQPTGACCNGTSCTIDTAGGCAASGGVAQAAGSACLPNPCNTVLTVPLNESVCADNFLYNNGSGQNFAGSQLYYYDERGTQLDRARPLIKFSLPTLPDCAEVQSVQLGLWVIDYTFIDAANGNAIVPWPFTLHRMLVDWDEGTSNWSERSAGNPWGAPGMAPGTDYESSSAASTVIDSNSTSTGQYKTWDITPLYLAWAGGTALNYGVCILGPDGNPSLTGPSGDTTDGVFRAANSEWQDDNVRPRLIITYTVGCVACCFADGSCQSLTSGACAGSGGTAQPAGSTCSPNACPVVTGACCDGTICGVTTPAACAGSFKGGGTVCEFAGNPVTCCRANFNHVGGVTVQDIFDFLGAYFGNLPAADINASGGVTVQDIFDFLSLYFAGCPG